MIRIYLALYNWFSCRLFQFLIIFHIEPHGEEEGLEARDGKKGRKECAGRRHRSYKEPVEEEIGAEKKPDRREDESEEIEEDEGVEVPDDIFFIDPPQEEFKKHFGTNI